MSKTQHSFTKSHLNFFLRLPHHKRPPNLLSPGVFNFKQEKSPEYYFHRSGARILKSSHFYMRYHLGRKISFVCVAEGYPRPQITWLKDGLELNSYAGYDAVGVSATISMARNSTSA